jgi:predicted translin family RNA/ssDNA-binding protein
MRLQKLVSVTSLKRWRKTNCVTASEICDSCGVLTYLFLIGDVVGELQHTRRHAGDILTPGLQ